MRSNDKDLSFPIAAADGGDPEFCPDGIPGLLDLPHAPRRVLCGDIAIHIDRDAQWHYAGSPIGRKELVLLFATTLRCDAQGTYWMATPAELGRITVDDVPFAVVELTATGRGRDQVIGFRSNLDETATIDDDHPLRIVTQDDGQPLPYVHVRDRLDGRLTRSAYYHLVDLGCEETIDGRRLFGVWSKGCFFPLGTDPIL